MVWEIIEVKQPIKNENTVTVSNLGHYINEVELEDLFSKYGLVNEANISHFKSPEGVSACKTFRVYMGFVKFYSETSAKRAVKALDNSYFKGTIIKCTIADRRKEREPFPLHPAKGHTLLNYYLGFNGWNNRIDEIKTIDEQVECKVTFDFLNDDIEVTGYARTAPTY
eukprot:Awhi_evm1s14233